MNPIRIIGACCKFGQKRSGVEFAPYLVEKELNINMQKVGDKEFNDEICFDYDKLYDLHGHELKSNKVLTIGGDHSISYSTISSALDKYKDSLHVIWIDAHTDINTQSTSHSGNLHGMPVGHLLKYETHPYATFNSNKLDTSQLTYIGIRDLDKPEIERVISSNIARNTRDLKRISKNSNIMLSIDVDALDPSEFPCTGTPVKNGLKLNDILKIIDEFKQRTVAIDIVEFNPLIGVNNSRYCTKQIKKLIDSL